MMTETALIEQAVRDTLIGLTTKEAEQVAIYASTLATPKTGRVAERCARLDEIARLCTPEQLVAFSMALKAAAVQMILGMWPVATLQSDGTWGHAMIVSPRDHL
jgi:hypothetical protein